MLAAAGCGNSLSRKDVESEVTRQAIASLQNTEGLNITGESTCAELPNASRTWDCRVRIRVNGKVSPSQEVTAIVSKDGSQVIVQGL